MDSVEYNRIFYLMNAPSATKDFHRLKVRVSPSPEVSTLSFLFKETGNECARFSIKKNIGNKDYPSISSIETTLQ